jgi:hypothetical protein
MALLAVFDDSRGGGECRSCHAPVVWFEMAKTGKRNPFDGDPVYVRTEHDPETHRLIGYIDGSITPSHFATCPQSRDWRRK